MIHDAAANSPLPIADYDYALPQELIAQTPIEPRDASRLMVVHRATGRTQHRHFRDIGDYLRSGDLLVVNDTRVLPARLHGRRPGGGQVEFLLVRRLAPGVWEAMGRPGRRLRIGIEIPLLDREGWPSQQAAVVDGRREGGLFAIRLPEAVEADLGGFGEVPLPPYIHEHLSDPERYQTVYAHEAGSAAAPTAGLHFTAALLDQLQDNGVRIARVTLHVGLGTFQPVKVDDAREHHMHAEWYHVPVTTLAAIRQAHARDGRVIAVGTTSCRTLESLGDDLAAAQDVSGWTDLFIAPGHRWSVVDALVTNFHLPRSTPLILVSAFAGRDLILQAYQEAVRVRNRFFSFGDAMLII